MEDPNKTRKLSQEIEQFLFESKKKLETKPAPQEPQEIVTSAPPVGFQASEIWPSLQFNNRHEIITFVETFYQTYRSLPNRADFVKQKHLKLPKFDAVDEWQELTLSLQDPLIARGIPPYSTPIGYLEPNFVLAVNLITNPLDKRTIQAKLKEAGLTTKQWSTFLLNTDSYNYYKERLNTIFDEQTQLDAKLALQKLIAQGDLQAIKHFHELQNIYRPENHNYNQQLQTIIMAIMEILTIYVEPKVLAIVSQELRNSKVIGSIEVGAA